MLREFAPKDKALLEQKDGLAEAVQTADTTRSLELLKRWSARLVASEGYTEGESLPR